VDADLTNRIAEARRAVRDLDALRARLGALDNSIAARKSELARLDDALRKEEGDVRRLDGLGLTAMFATMLGTKEARRSKECAEALKAKLSRDACADALSGLHEDRTDHAHRIKAAGDPHTTLAGLLEEKEAALRGAADPLVERLDSIDSARADACAAIQEIAEAIRAADGALLGLARVEESLESAAGWGTYDMLGGGMIATWAKHQRIDDARNEAHAAQRALDRFARELKDVQGPHGQRLIVDIGEFMTFADFFFDGLIVDWCVQQRIADSRDNVHAAVRRVRDVRQRLVAQDRDVRFEFEALAQERRRIVETGDAAGD
jgi:predicted  nucleic acid-binding Zn-ribbon protein